MVLPSISVVIPTLNAGHQLEQCFRSILSQDYPRVNIEIIIAYAGSRDSTLSIAKEYKIECLHNPLKTAESGKAVGIRRATRNLVLLMDADNILVGSDWLRKMVRPFEDPEIVSEKPLTFMA